MSSTVVPLRTADIMETPADGLYDPTKQKSFSVPKEAKPTAYVLLLCCSPLFYCSTD